MAAPLSVPRPAAASSSTSSSPPSSREQSRNALVELHPPAFLRQSRLALRQKFASLTVLQRGRLEDAHKNPESRFKLPQDEASLVRNRYLDIQPWANSRVHLKVPEGECDYINASPVSLQSSTGTVEKYISTQGPKNLLFGHFWGMVWHETADVAVIVMLTRTFESGREKCSQYFPAEMGSEPMMFQVSTESSKEVEGSIRLEEYSEDDATRSIIRKLSLRVGEVEKTVWHFLFAGWPDHTIPEREDRAALVKLIALSVEKNEGTNNPRIVHCSAGVGRSGTFIALDHLLRELHSGGMDNVPDDVDKIYETVTSLREQRMWMVQSEPQYAFIYQVLMEEWNARQAGSIPASPEPAQTDKTPIDEVEDSDEEDYNDEAGPSAKRARLLAELVQNVQKAYGPIPSEGEEASK
ncbi:hypothetical protein L228DRAFT_259766 [Xylona heveae TC161]|uniref:Protein-tyrosine phosphatase 2 n=1 Tax=Xylona heveae (strain CBS 132557 / TC161) TaxID=1328760 RepID=A0A165I921_XYLHT|nr:hypothetical protein L228DRAFT_259766 [Xylona heveae TC161]KZF24563.1 hypothetical protein L228DRAFT_259766 [Xylona heveae TC161]